MRSFSHAIFISGVLLEFENEGGVPSFGIGF